MRLTARRYAGSEEAVEDLCQEAFVRAFKALPRLDRILIGYTPAGKPVLASEIGVTGAMMAILNEAICPNLVQSREGVPAFVHGGRGRMPR